MKTLITRMANPRKVASNPPGVPAPIRGYYSNCVRVSAGPLLFVAGQVGMDTNGATPEGAGAQCEIEAVAVAP